MSLFSDLGRPVLRPHRAPCNGRRGMRCLLCHVGLITSCTSRKFILKRRERTIEGAGEAPGKLLEEERTPAPPSTPGDGRQHEGARTRFQSERRRRPAAWPADAGPPCQGERRVGGMGPMLTPAEAARSSSWMGPLPPAPPTPVRGQRM